MVGGDSLFTSQVVPHCIQEYCKDVTLFYGHLCDIIVISLA